MTNLTVESFTIPSASLGKPNPLPDIQKPAEAYAPIAIDKDTVTAEESKYMNWGRVSGILPYLIQDGYDRQKKPKAWKSVVLENQYLRAVFLAEIGGRLWSLFDKAAGRELLHRNPVFQPCNLALRNAWVSGGVEWNIGIIGHHPYTVDHMFAEKLSLSDGTPVLRLYQYERVRRLVYRVEAVLPDESRQLFIRVKINNASKNDTAVYWWSNMAVDEGEDIRVLVPAGRTFRWGSGLMTKIGYPKMALGSGQTAGAGQSDGARVIDASHPTQLPQAMDFFYDIPAERRKWIAAVNRDGYGIVQTSTQVLQGRKLWVFGMNAGGRHWQSFLALPGYAYIELQSGLAHTQMEHLPMEGGKELDWIEAYGAVQADKSAVSGEDWPRAVNAVETSLAAACPEKILEELHSRIKTELDGATGESVHTGPAWAFVQRELLKDDFLDGGLAFPEEALGKTETAWLNLVRKRKLECPSVSEAPDSYQYGPEWEALLKETISEGGSDHWYGHYQYGVTLARAEKYREARQEFLRSVSMEENPWALRCLATLDQMEGREMEAASLLTRAAAMATEVNIVKETLQLLIKLGRSAEAKSIADNLPEDIRGSGRIKVLTIEALLDAGDTDGAGKIMDGGIELTDVKEGEVKLTDLWYRMMAMKRFGRGNVTDEELEEVKAGLAPPEHLDFRMS